MPEVSQIDAGLSPAFTGAESSERLERALRAQRALAWVLSISTLVITVTFFVMMTQAASLLSRVVLGHSITLATVLAAAVILFYLGAITVFARQSDRVDAEFLQARGTH